MKKDINPDAGSAQILGKILFILLAPVSMASAFTVSGSTYTTNGSASDVQAAVNAAPNGSKILIPDGSYTWSSQVNISNFVILQAQNMPTWPTPSNVNISHGGGSTYLISISASSAGNTTLAGINFLAGSGTNSQSWVGVQGTSQPVLMHDCTFNVPNFQLLHAVEWYSGNGVVWHCHFFCNSGQGSGSGCFYNMGNLPWYGADTFGTQDSAGTTNFYLEDCIFDNLYNQALDFGDNARAVVRYNTLNNSQGLTHGDTGLQGGRAIELYNNSFNYTQVNGQWVPMSRWFWWRAGTARVHDNNVQQIASGGYYSTASSWQFIDESLTRSGVGSPCQTEGNYPGWHWPGTGGNGTSEIVDPVYIWNNSGGGASSWSTNDQTGTDQNCSGGSTGNVFLLNRDIFLSAPPGNYAPYTYPHPLRNAIAGGGPSATPLAPQNLRVQ